MNLRELKWPILLMAGVVLLLAGAFVISGEHGVSVFYLIPAGTYTSSPAATDIVAGSPATIPNGSDNAGKTTGITPASRPGEKPEGGIPPSTVLQNGSLIPELSEDEAWAVAEKTFAQHGVTDILPSERKETGLYLSNPDPGPRHLKWQFVVVSERPGIYGGIVGIDADDGHVAYYASL